MDVENVEMLVDGYDVLVQEAGIKLDSEIEDSHLNLLQNLLVTDGDWSPYAAQELVFLAKRYGVFMLRNVLALSIVLGIDDGDAGF